MWLTSDGLVHGAWRPVEQIPDFDELKRVIGELSRSQLLKIQEELDLVLLHTIDEIRETISYSAQEATFQEVVVPDEILSPLDWARIIGKFDMEPLGQIDIRWRLDEITLMDHAITEPS